VNIGDIFFGFRGEDSGLQVDAKKAGMAAGEGFGGSFGGKVKSAFGTGGVVGVGVAAGMMAFNALGASIHGVIGFMGDAVNAAMEDEASQVKLRAALEANVKGWDGNTDAIEKVIKARMRLGFTDEEQRASLAVLVARTGDVTSALAIQGAAMDLARLKGIDLAAASKAIALGMGGQGRALKELGINVKDYATGTEILAAIQAKASGQAEGYANTTAGAMAAMQVQIDEATEAIGYRLLPYVKKLAEFTRDNLVPAVDELGTSLDNLSNNTDKEVDGIKGATNFLHDFAAGLLFGDDAAWSAARAQLGLEAAVAKASVTMYGAAAQSRMLAADLAATGSAAAAATPQINSTTRVLTGLGDVADDVTTATARMYDKIKSTWSALSGIASGAASAIFGPATRAVAAAANAREIAAQKEIIASKKSTAAEKQDAKDRLLALQQEGLGIQIEMAGRGELSKAAYATLISTLQTQAKSGNLEVANAATVALQELARLKVGIIGVNVALEAHGAFQGVGKTYARAGGGPVSAGMPYIVNEDTARSEWFVPNVSGTILTAAQAASQGAGRGGPTYNVTVNNPEPRAAEADIGRVLRRTAALGMAQ
jgi:hypothetical protein